MILGVIYNTKDGIGYITIDNPKKANILDRETSNEISEVWKAKNQQGEWVEESRYLIQLGLDIRSG